MRILALILVLGALAFWTAAGAHRGWSKTSVPKTTFDAVTGIEGVTYEKGFVPGLDFLALAFLAGTILAAASLIVPDKRIGT